MSKNYTFDDRLFAKIDVGDCWHWTGARSHGYGSFSVGDRKQRQAHRVVYEHLVGPVDVSLDLDHLCRNKLCVNPDHLEPVTRRVNTQRGIAGLKTRLDNAAKTHCPQGHPYSGENLIVESRGNRRCRTCARRISRERNRRIYREAKNVQAL